MINVNVSSSMTLSRMAISVRINRAGGTNYLGELSN